MNYLLVAVLIFSQSCARRKGEVKSATQNSGLIEKHTANEICFSTYAYVINNRSKPTKDAPRGKKQILKAINTLQELCVAGKGECCLALVFLMPTEVSKSKYFGVGAYETGFKKSVHRYACRMGYGYSCQVIMLEKEYSQPTTDKMKSLMKATVKAYQYCKKGDVFSCDMAGSLLLHSENGISVGRRLFGRAPATIKGHIASILKMLYRNKFFYSHVLLHGSYLEQKHLSSNIANDKALSMMYLKAMRHVCTSAIIGVCDLSVMYTGFSKNTKLPVEKYAEYYYYSCLIHRGFGCEILKNYCKRKPLSAVKTCELLAKITNPSMSFDEFSDIIETTIKKLARRLKIKY